jgi:hypothetical protein
MQKASALLDCDIPRGTDLKVLNLNNQCPLHKYLMMRKCPDGIKNFRW